MNLKIQMKTIQEAKKENLGKHSTPSWLGRVKADDARTVLRFLRQKGEVAPRAIYRDRSGQNRYHRSFGPGNRPIRSGWCLRKDATHADIYDRGGRIAKAENLIEKLLEREDQTVAEDLGAVSQVKTGLARLGWTLDPRADGVLVYDSGDGVRLSVSVEPSANGVLTAYVSGKKDWTYDKSGGEARHTEEFDMDDIDNVGTDKFGKRKLMSNQDFAEVIHDFAQQAGPDEPRGDLEGAVGPGYGHHKAHPMDRF